VQTHGFEPINDIKPIGLHISALESKNLFVQVKTRSQVPTTVNSSNSVVLFLVDPKTDATLNFVFVFFTPKPSQKHMGSPSIERHVFLFGQQMNRSIFFKVRRF